MIQQVNLDAHELFSQLCVITHVVQPGPRRGIFKTLEEVSDGVVRIWRDWLAKNATSSNVLHSNPPVTVLTPIEYNLGNESRPVEAELEAFDMRMLWADTNKNVGIRVRVREQKWKRDAPVLLRKDEDIAISYEMQYEGQRISRTNPEFIDEC